MSTSVPPQIGASGLVVHGAPRFANFVVIDNTWKKSDALQVQKTRDGNSNMFNYTGWSPGDDAQCDWNIIKGNAPAKTMDIVIELLPLHFSGQPVNATTIPIGGVTYTFKTVLSGAADEVLIGATLAATLANLIGAIMDSSAGGQAAGTTFGTGTVVNPNATAMLDPLIVNSVLIAQVTPVTTGNVLSVGPGTATVITIAGLPITSAFNCRAFIVQEKPEDSEYGGRVLKQAVKLAYHADGFVPALVT
jgi:hypothetical protein